MTTSDTLADDAGTRLVRIVMPHQLRALAGVTQDVLVKVGPPVTLGGALDALEAEYPTLLGTIRNRGTGQRRAMIRLYADGEDFSDVSPETELPPMVVAGREPLRLVGAIAGG